MSERDGIDFDIIEMLYFAYRDFTSDPDAILAEFGFGRAHHRVVHFVNRQPGMTVADLLETLKITKQSLASGAQTADRRPAISTRLRGLMIAARGVTFIRPTRAVNWPWNWQGHSLAA